MTTLAEYAPRATYRLCIFGRAKVGKTALAAQLAKVWKLHYFDLEDGIKTALKPDVLAPEFWKNINVFPIASRQSAPMGIETLLKLIRGTECKICLTHGKVNCPACVKAGATINRIALNELTPDDCLVIDSSTQLSVDANAAAVAFIFRDADTPEQFVLDKDTGGKNFKYPMAVSFMLDRIFGYLQTATNFNSIVISHEVMTEKLKDTGHTVPMGQNQPTLDTDEMVFPAAGSRNFSRQFGRYFDALIHLDIVNKKHRAYSSTTYNSRISTGSRLAYNIEEILGADKQPLPPFEAIVELVKRSKTNVGK